MSTQGIKQLTKKSQTDVCEVILDATRGQRDVLFVDLS